ncbi:MAG: RAMP superfamily CRISPR-associated protein [Caldilinea sp.]
MFRAITATLVVSTPLHIGTGRGTETADDLIRRTADGYPLIPGTAIAGALRSIATRLATRFDGEAPCQAFNQALDREGSRKACGCIVCQLFGDVNPQEDAERASAARLLVYDAVLDTLPALQIRDGVGIDRVTGAAARRERIKFDLEVLPAGATFHVRFEIDARLQDVDKTLPLLAAALTEWEQRRGAIGGRVNRGLGAFQLTNVQWIERDLNQPVTLIEFLRNGPPWDARDGDLNWLTQQVALARSRITPKPSSDSPVVARSWALAEFTLAATGPFLTNDLTQAGRSGFDHAPLLAAYTKGAKPVLPGSSLRGVLRSQAERIARTLATHKAWDAGPKASEQRQKFLSICPACNPLTTKANDPVASCNSLIKSTMSKKERDELEQTGAEEKLCLACRLFGSTWNGSRLRVEDAPFVGERVEYKALDFLAIDRFTGGGRDSAKFDAIVLWQPKFRVRLLLDNPEAWELGWLALVLRDLHEGLSTVGFGRAKGFGAVEIKDERLTLGFLTDDDFPQPQAPADNSTVQAAQSAAAALVAAKGVSSGVYQTAIYEASRQASWLELAEGWVKTFHTAINGHKHSFEVTTDSKDSYFTEINGIWLSEIYPVRVS